MIAINDHSDGEHAGVRHKPKIRLKARLAEVTEIAGDVQLPVTGQDTLHRHVDWLGVVAAEQRKPASSLPPGMPAT